VISKPHCLASVPVPRQTESFSEKIEIYGMCANARDVSGEVECKTQPERCMSALGTRVPRGHGTLA